MSARLLACPSCARHVRVDEERCPFCHDALPDDFGGGAVPVPPPRGLLLGRTGVFGVVGGGVAMSIAASCAAPEQQRVLYGGPPIELILERRALDLADAAAHAGDTGQPDASIDAPSDAGDGG